MAVTSYETKSKYGRAIPQPTIVIDYWEGSYEGGYEASVNIEFTPEGLWLHSEVIPWAEVDRMRVLVKEEK